MRLIRDGVVDREGVRGLAKSLAYSERHLHRQLHAALGAGPLALARAHRAQTARLLIEGSSLPFYEIASGAGFNSVRQFNETIRQVFGRTPRELRGATRPSPQTSDLMIHLPYRGRLDWGRTLEFLRLRALPGVEEVVEDVYRRTLRLPCGPAIVELRPGSGLIMARMTLTDLRDLAPAVERVRRLLDLDCDISQVESVLCREALMRRLVAASRGLRVPGSADGTELAIRAVLGQQITVQAARALGARIVEKHGQRLPQPYGSLTRVFPTAGVLAEAELSGMPVSRQRALRGLAAALASGQIDLHPGADRRQTASDLHALPGLGAWTASYIAMRALGDPDAFLATDAGVRNAIKRLGRPSDPPSVIALASRWRPFRSYAVLHLWSSLARTSGDLRSSKALVAA